MTNQEFTKQYNKLNQKQKEAVDNIEGPVMVIAGPGTGKTTVLTLRIANILRLTDTPPSGILALTFTDIGVRNMRIKLREIIGSDADKVRIHTFHSFASHIIREFPEHFVHLNNTSQITEIEAEKIIREILREKRFKKLRPLGEPDFYIAKIISTIAESKKEAWTSEILKNFAQKEINRIKNDKNSISERGKTAGLLKANILKRIEKCERTILFSEVYNLYEKKKKQEKKIDFDDLLFELSLAMKKDELLLRLIQENFLYILVDEHQDTNDVQNLLIRSIANFFENPNIFIVGDEKQAIYRFQGASVENFLYFEKIWPTIKLINLEENYRSHQNILDASFSMIELNYNESEHNNLRIKLKSKATSEKKPIELLLMEDRETELVTIAERVKEILKKEDNSKISILVRKNKDVSEILTFFEMIGIKAYAERGIDIWKHFIGLSFFYITEYLLDPSKIESLSNTISAGLWGLKFEKQSKLIKIIKSGKLKDLEKEIPEIKELRLYMQKSGPLEFLQILSDLSGITDIILKSIEANEVWRKIFSLAKDIVASREIESPPELLKAIFDYKLSAEKKIAKINYGKDTEKVSILTAHSSKGLEFDYVFVAFATEENWISKNRGDFFVLPREKQDYDDIKDDRRLFYVAITRAKKHLVISLCKQDGNKTYTPLRFLEELDKRCIERRSIKSKRIKRNKKSIEDLEKEETEKIIEYAKNIILEKGLSVTALNHFLNCPSEFFYKSIMKVPEAPSIVSEKGTAMHNAIAKLWNSNQKTEKVMIESIENYFQNSSLTVFEKDSILEELKESIPKVFSNLKNHFSIKNNVLVENWFEKIIKFRGEDIKLHGKLDAVVEYDDKIYVFDYKTSTSKNINEIKGLIKNSNGDYFRQLIFYKILLEENQKYKNKNIEPALVFVKPDSKGKCSIVNIDITKEDIIRVNKEIENLLNSVWDGKFLTDKCTDTNCNFCKYKSKP